MIIRLIIFFDGFNFFTDDDPTNGYVNYINYTTAVNEGLVKNGTTTTPVYFAADSTHVATGRGRDSIRLESKKIYNNGLIIIDLTHMPTGCSTWPAFWTYGPNWPVGGEIDIIEGVNVMTADATTLHTMPTCDMSGVDTKSFTGTWAKGLFNNPADDCSVFAPDEGIGQGCSVIAANNTFGSPFNKNQGGVIATEWDPQSAIRMWYWPRTNIPSDITNLKPDPSTWGLPYTNFILGTNCPSTHFVNHSITFDLTFCGDWAGDAWADDCPGLGTCENYVKNNPANFTESYWLVNYVRVFSKY